MENSEEMHYMDKFVIYSNIEQQWITTINDEQAFVHNMKLEGYNIELKDDEFSDFDREVVSGALFIKSTQPEIKYGLCGPSHQYGAMFGAKRVFK